MKNILFYFFVCYSITVSYAQETLEVLVSNGNDDVEVQDDGGFSSGSGDLELNGYDGEPQTTYIRFRNITLPADVEITSAYIEFVGDENRTGISSINIYGEVGNSEEYTNASNIKNREYTTSFITWTTNGSRTNEKYRTPDIRSLLLTMFSERIDDENVGFKLEGNEEGGFTTESYEGSRDGAPKLIINYNTDQKKVIESIGSNSNDAEEYLTTGEVRLGEGVLEIGEDDQITGLRFENVKIPSNAEISRAYIEFYSYGDNNTSAKITIKSELGNATVFEEKSNNITSRNFTKRRIAWTTDTWQNNTKYKTPNLKEIIDENRLSGWESGQALAFVLEGEDGNGNIRARSRNNSETYQPRLVIEYLNNEQGSSVGEAPLDEIINIYVSDNNNDAEENLMNGSIELGDNDLEIGEDQQITGLRFENVKIPADAEIEDAYIEFYSYGRNDDEAEIVFRSELGNSLPYENKDNNITARSYSLRKVKWNTNSWQDNEKYRSPNLKEIIDENRLSGWEPGQSLAFKLEGDGGDIEARSRSYENYQPRLVIKYLRNGKGPSVGEAPLDETIRIYVSNRDNDAEENLMTGEVRLGEGVLEIGENDQITGLRFEDVKIPSNAEISRAYIEFYSYGDNNTSAKITIKSELGNATVFEEKSNNITSRNFTKRRIAWTTDTWQNNTKYKTPNLKEIIDENRLSGWESGQALAFVLEGEDGNGNIRARSRNNSETYQPRLVIEYLNNEQGPSVGEAPLDETIRIYVSNRDNDVEENLTNGSVRTGDGVLEIGEDDQITGLRFENVRIPSNAEIEEAYIELYSYGSDGQIAEITISCELENAEIYSSEDNSLTDRLYVKNTNLWNVEQWNFSNTKYQTSNLKKIIDENRLSGWKPGQALAFKLEGNGKRVRAWSRNGSEDNQPRLVIKYLNNDKGPDIEGIETDVSKMDKLYINEVASSGSEKQGSDWIELYNDHDFPVYIEKDMYLSDKEDDKKQHKLKDIYIPAKGFTVLYADGSPEEGNKHLDFKLSSKGESIYLSRKVNDVVSVLDSVAFPEFKYNQSYGRVSDGLEDWTVFMEPTYYKTNANTAKKVDLEFSKKRGVYPSEFTVTLTSTDGATIKYTTDGSYPSETNGETYDGTPVKIEENTVLKAYAYTTDGYSEVIAHSYFLENNLSNEEGWQHKSTLTDAEYAQALNEFPIVSISGNSISFDRNYKVTSFEFIDNQLDKDNETFFSNSGTKKFGQWAYGLSSGNYKSKFSKDYGVEKASYPFFDEVAGDAFPPEDISRIELKEGEDGPQHDIFGLGYARLSEKLVMNTLKEMDTYASSTRFVHLYLNGRYYGVRTLREDFHPNNLEEYFGDDDDNYTEVDLRDGRWSSGYVESGDGSREKWDEVKDHIDNKDFQKIKEMVDVDGYIKQLMVYVLMDMENEAKAIGHNQAPNYTKFRFLLNDTDGALWNRTAVNCGDYESKWRSAGCSIDGPADLSRAFIGTNIGYGNNVKYTESGNLEFKTMLKDRILNYMEKEGSPLTAEVLNQKIDRLQEELDVSYKMDVAYLAFNRNAYELWKENLVRIKEEMPERIRFVLDKWKQKDLTHSLQPAAINYGTGNQVSFVNPNENTKTYYTLNGSDPMGNDGVVAPNAIEFTGETVTLSEDAKITVRAFTTNNWGPLSEDEFEVKRVPDLMITGIHYNPKLDTESEFLLLTNVGEEDLEISGYQITEGIDFEFPQGTTLTTNETIIIAKDLTLLSGFDNYQQYEWTDGKLSNGGELIKLESASKETIDEVTYDDKDPWNPLADGEGYYLKLISTDLDNNLGESWEAVELNTNKASREKSIVEPELNLKSTRTDDILAKAYPIPFDEQLNILFNQDEENIMITMYNFSGNVVLKKNYKKVYASQPVMLNTRYLKTGAYFVHIQSKAIRKVIKVTKR